MVATCGSKRLTIALGAATLGLVLSSVTASHAADPAVWPSSDTASLPAASSPAPPPHESDFAREVRAAYWRDRTCLTPECRARRGSWIDIASFGVAAAGGVFVARRRDA